MYSKQVQYESARVPQKRTHHREGERTDERPPHIRFDIVHVHTLAYNYNVCVVYTLRPPVLYRSEWPVHRSHSRLYNIHALYKFMHSVEQKNGNGQKHVDEKL